MSSDYQLINPTIKGNLQTIFKAYNPLEAAKYTWNLLTKNFTNLIPQFAFTLKSLKDNKLFHFKVNEKPNADKVDYNIIELQNIPSNKNELLLSRITNLDQPKGGKRRRWEDDDDDEDEDDAYLYAKLKYDNLLNNLSPIQYWWYDPSIYNLSSFYIPTFVVPLTPYIEIQQPSIIIQ